MRNKKYVSRVMGLAVLATLVVAVPALAQTATITGSVGVNIPTAWGGHTGSRQGVMKPGVFGTVSAVSGNTITISGKQGFGTTTTTVTFTVDATNAKVMKNNATSTVSAIAVGDTVMVAGTVTGTNVTATMIRDGVTMHGGMKNGMQNPNGQNGTQTPPVSPITGNGQPVVAGTVSSVSGSTLTITNKSNVTYTIDTSSAKIVQGNTTVTISSVATGDMIFVQGTVNGTSITATSVIDQKAPSANTTTPPAHKGFFGSIGSFFSHLFGF